MKRKSRKVPPNVLSANIEGYVKELAGLTIEAQRSEYFKEYLDAMSCFWEYSHANQILIRLTMKHATQVAGYRTWIKLGRQVKKDEHGIWILAPCHKTTAKVDKATGEESDMNVRYFISVPVWDVSQTHGKPLPSPDLDVAGNDFLWLRDNLLQVCSKKNIEVVYQDLGVNGAYGFATKKGIVICSGQEVNTEVNTLIHELTHMLLHLGKADKPSKSEREIDAEGVAYVVMKHFGMESKSFNYLALYNPDVEKIMSRMKTISDTSREIIKSISTMDLIENAAPLLQSC